MSCKLPLTHLPPRDLLPSNLSVALRVDGSLGFYFLADRTAHSMLGYKCHHNRAGKKLGFLEKSFFVFLVFKVFYRFLGFLDFSVAYK